jgi:DEAD/DEAH box helicase domain-containing protein
MTLGLATLIDDLRRDPELALHIAHAEHLPAVAERPAPPDPPLPAPLSRALAGSGIPHLWSHQAEGWKVLAAGENLLVTTPTASGKSLVFQLPVLAEAARGGPGRALFLFPLKALGQDQRAKVEALARAAELPRGTARVEIYDGDTPQTRRLAIRRDPPRVLITNPDMLHVGVLAHGESWTPFFADLRWIVLDELHTYRGIFGSHFHHVLERLLRQVRAVQGGREPQLVASSATAQNAAEFAALLTGRRFHTVSESGAPREGRHFLLLDPQGSPYTAVLDLLVRFLSFGLKTIVFTKARRITELLYSWLSRGEPEVARRVACYRAGFLPEERRRIEARLFAGELDGVISTSALEMGIDVGGLDACILVGYPGSRMATWQRSGRVGRSGRESLTALVAMPDALDQYLLEHPEEFLRRPCEPLIVDPANPPVARGHLPCAAAEAPLHRERDRAYLELHGAAVEELAAAGELLPSPDGATLRAARRRPQREVALRGSGATYTIEDHQSERVIGTVDGVRAFHECHPGAVYLHGGRSFVIEELDLKRRAVRAKGARVDYFTTPLTRKETRILELLEDRREGPLTAGLARLTVTEHVVGYERKRVRTQEVLDQLPLELPPVSFETVGLFFAAAGAIEETLRRRGEHFLGALHAAEHAAISLFPLLALCDRGDIGGISLPFHPQLNAGAVFVYDGHPGGVGLSTRGFRELDDLLARVIDLLDGCGCAAGCPACIQSPKCGNGNRPLDKSGARAVLALLLGREAPAIPFAPLPPVDLAAPPVPEAPAVGAPATETPAAAPRRGGPRRRATPATTVLFDLETLRSAEAVGGWGQAHRMGVALGVVCFLEEGRFEVYREDRVRDLAATLEAADLVVGYNVKGFDYKVLSGYTGVDYARKLPTLDLLEDLHRALGFRVGLDALARATLGTGKTADGLQCLQWVREGRLDLVEAYCRADVEVLRDIYLHGRREGCVRVPDRQGGGTVTVSVKW